MITRRLLFSALAALAVVPNAVKTARARGAVGGYVHGRGLNIVTESIDDVLLIYRIRGRDFTQIVDVRDGGIALLCDGDDLTVERLAEAVISPGHYRTCLAAGCFRLGGSPVFPVTADVWGHDMMKRVSRMDEMCGAVRDGTYSSDWLSDLERQGLLVRTWDSDETARRLLNWRA